MYSRLQRPRVATRYTTTIQQLATTTAYRGSSSSITSNSSSDRASCTCTPFSHLPNNHHAVLTSRPTFQSRFIIATSMISPSKPRARRLRAPPLDSSGRRHNNIYLFHKFRRPHMFVVVVVVYTQHILCAYTHTSAIIYYFTRTASVNTILYDRGN